MRYIALFSILFNFTLFAQDADKVVEENIEVVLGIDKIVPLDYDPDKRFQIGNPQVLRIDPVLKKNPELTFVGLRPGRTSVIIRNKVGDIKSRYLVIVTENDQSKIVKELKDFLGDVEGLEIGVKGETVYVGGQIVVPADIGKVVTLLRQDKFSEVLFLVEISPQTQKLIAEKMQEEIQKNQLRDVTVRVVNNLFWLEGIVGSDAEKQRAELIATAFFPDQIPSLAERTDSVRTVKKAPIQNFIQVNAKQQPKPIPKLVKVTAQFVELTKDYKKIFGFKWQPLLSEGQGAIRFGRTTNDGLSTSSSGTLSGVISNLIPKLTSAKSAGFARVIQSGVVITKDKVKARINKQDEVPFELGTGEFTRGEKATSGFTLDVTPEILQEEKIDLSMGISVSANTGNPPTVQKNDVSTAIIVKSKESAVVGGIVVNKNATAFDKDPPGGVQETDETTSELFSFVRSKARTTSKSQFVVFVTPEIVESASQGTDEIKRKFRRRRR